MGDHNKKSFANSISQPFMEFLDADDAAQAQLRAERIAAERQAIVAEAYRQMPADLRERAKEWGVSALMELVWLNGWDCGYRQSTRDSAAIRVRKE